IVREALEEISSRTDSAEGPASGTALCSSFAHEGRASKRMIFCFNTDVKAADNVVYHVQSEARVNDLLLQTQVFVKGHCIGKRASSYAELAVQPNFSTEEMHEMLKSQHKLMLEGVKAGKMQD